MLLFASCTSPVCGCPPIDISATVILDGVVLDSASIPVLGAEISPFGLLGFDCTVDTNPLGADPNPAVSGSDGQFTVLLKAWLGHGMHCFDLLVRVPSSGATDTIRDIQAEFRPDVEIPDTVTVQIVVAS